MAGWQESNWCQGVRKQMTGRQDKLMWLVDKSNIDVKVRKEVTGWQEQNLCQGHETAEQMTRANFMLSSGTKRMVDKSKIYINVRK